MLSDASLASNIRQQITLPPSPSVLPWKMLPVLDEKAIAYQKRLEALRKERDRARAEADKIAAQRRGSSLESTSYRLPSAFENKGKLDGAINFSAASNSSFLSNVRGESTSSEDEPSRFGAALSSHHRKTSSNSEAPRKRRNIDSNFIAGNLQFDIFGNK